MKEATMITPRNDETISNETSDGNAKRSVDKFLLAIVIGAILLVIIVFIVTLTRPKQDYLPDNTPEGVAHNYLFALEKGDYQRAHGYLSPDLEGYPKNSDELINAVEDYSYSFDQDRVTSYQIESVNSTEKTAIINIRETTFYEGGIFGSNENSRTFKIHLGLENGEWKIFDSDRYFAWCWQQEEGCP